MHRFVPPQRPQCQWNTVSKQLFSLKYVNIDNAIKEIFHLGQGTLLAKIHIKSTFCLLPVHQADRHMLGMQWNEGVYIDASLPSGLRSAPKLFNVLGLECGVSFLTHYLDDFLTVGPLNLPTESQPTYANLQVPRCSTCHREG